MLRRMRWPGGLGLAVAALVCAGCAGAGESSPADAAKPAKHLEPVEAANRAAPSVPAAPEPRVVPPAPAHGPATSAAEIGRPLHTRFGDGGGEEPVRQPVWVPVVHRQRGRRAAARSAREARPGRPRRPVGVPAGVEEGPRCRRPLGRPDGRPGRPPQAGIVPRRQGLALHAHADRPLLRHRPTPVRAGEPVRPVRRRTRSMWRSGIVGWRRPGGDPLRRHGR